MNWLRNSKKKTNYKCFTFFRKMTNEFILPRKPHIVAITRTDSKCYQKAILQLYHLFPWQRNLIKPNKRWHAFFFTYQSLSNCKVWINIWLSVATEFLFLHINDLNCLLLFFSIRTNMFCIIGKKEDIKAVMEIAIAFPLFSVIKLF